MTFDELLSYCLAKPGAWQDEPWEGDVVAKVGGRLSETIDGSYSAAVSKTSKERPSLTISNYLILIKAQMRWSDT